MKKYRFYSWSELPAELKRRRVYPVIAAYAVGAFILLQIGEITFAPLGLPNWVMVSLIALVILGFPVAVVLAWIFDITPTGIRRDSATLPRAEDVDPRPSIAVLPFVDMSAEQDQGYFCEGVAEEILNALTKIRQLNVAARSSSFQYKTSVGDVRDMGRELGVKTILEGSVRKAENRLRVTAQLVKVSDGYHLWSKTFDAELKDVFAIQDDIAACIAESLLETLTPTEQLAIRTTSTADVSAYEYYLRGRQFFKRFRKKDIEHARQMFRQAIKIDADFALAWAGYADCHSFLIMYVDPQASYREEADDASKRALELSPDLAEAHASRGLACLVCEEFEAAEEEFKIAIELNPCLFEAYYYYARTQFHRGDVDKSLDYLERAIDHGAVSAAWMRSDEDLVNLRDHNRYADSLRRAEAG
jgi:TolB-like protein/Tfp pilus assembly protein PilF